MTNSITTNATPNKQISFSANNVMTPPTTSPNNQIIITTFSSTNALIDSSVCSVTPVS
jgi:hypothetical protein